MKQNDTWVNQITQKRPWRLFWWGEDSWTRLDVQRNLAILSPP